MRFVPSLELFANRFRIASELSLALRYDFLCLTLSVSAQRLDITPHHNVHLKILGVLYSFKHRSGTLFLLVKMSHNR
jgi:hypothetical protein